MKYALILLMAIGFTMPEFINAQELAYGFRVGLNQSTFTGPKEEVGGTTESFSLNSGFHVGGGVRFKFTDLFGIRAELLFSQKGSKTTFEGESFQIFRSENGVKIFATGNKTVSLNVSNAYIEIPITAYGKLGEKLEFFGGVYAGFLVSSTAAGQFEFRNGVYNGNNLSDINLNIEYNFYRDDVDQELNLENAFSFLVGNELVVLPTRLPAYFDLDEKNGSRYNALDAGVTGGVAFYLNSGLFVSVAASYGFLDVTNDDMDFSNTVSENENYVTRSDNDQNLSLQFSIGFSF